MRPLADDEGRVYLNGIGALMTETTERSLSCVRTQDKDNLGTKKWAFSSVQSLSRVRLFETPWIAAHQASLSITNSWSLPKLMSIESVMPSSHLILCRPLLLLFSIFPSTGSFPVRKLFSSGGQSIGVSASASVLPMNIQNWFPLELIGFIFLQSKGLSRVFSNISAQKHQFFCTQLSL